MVSKYQEFAQKARERYLAKQEGRAAGKGGYQFTRHAEYKMQQYGLSEQKVRGVIRNFKRREVGIMPKTVAVMQPVGLKVVAGKDVWKQEIWVMYIQQGTGERVQGKGGDTPRERHLLKQKSLPSPLYPQSYKIISAWRYPGISPKRSPIPEDILRELELLEDVG